MLRRKVLSLVTVLMSVFASGLAFAQDATTPPPAAPPAAEPAPATPPPADVVVGDQPAAAAAPGAAEEKTEEIVVTGTRIRRKDLTTPAPVTVISRDQITASGKISLGEFLQSLPEQGNTVNTQVNNGNDGSVRVALRSLDSKRTLVLVNGRRMVAGGTEAEAAVDLNTIPAAAIERIEVLKDGASAVYGSDAVAGVVNVILKKRFSGTEVSGYTGTTSRGDGTVYDLSAITGTTSERGNIMFSVGYQEQQKVIAGDRSWAETTFDYDWDTGALIPSGNSSTFPEGRFSLPVVRDPVSGDIVGCRTGGTPLYNQLCTEAINAQNNIFVPNAGAASGYVNYDFSLFNTNPTNYLITPNRRIQIFATGDTNVGDVARGFFEASYVNRTSSQSLAAMPVVNNTIPNKPVSVSKDSLYNPFGVDITSWRRRTVELGERRWSQDLDTFRVVTGLDGQLGDWAGPLQGWTWEFSYNYGRTSGQEVNGGQLRMPNVANAVGPSMIDPVSGQPICVRVANDADTVIPGCVPWDVLHGVQPFNAAVANYVSFAGTVSSMNRQDVYSANLGGELFTLPTSDQPIGVAVGADYRRQSAEYLPDVITSALESSGNNTLPTAGRYDVKEGYAELSVPIVTGMPFANLLQADAAVRFFDYSTFGSDNTYKFGARWSPFRDITVRGTFSTAFRAPNVGELYGGTTDSFEFVGDPCSEPDPSIAALCQQDTGIPGGATGDPSTQLLTKWISTPDLQPETADIWTAGLVLEPRWVRNLTVTLDYYNIKIDNYIDLHGANFILDGCYPTSGTRDQAMCDLIIRGSDGLIVQINDPRNNLYTYETSGLDFAARYGLPTPAFGRFNFVVDGTLLFDFTQTDPRGKETQGRGFYDLGALPRLKLNAGVLWGLGEFGAGVATRYVGGYTECEGNLTGLCATDASLSRRVSSYMPFDVFVTYDMKAFGRTNIALGMQNVADTKPPYLYNAGAANSDPSTYDYLGRYAYVRLTQAF